MRLKRWLAAAGAGALLVTVACSGSKPPAPPQSAAAPAALDRTVLPIPEPSYPPITELDVRNATPPPRFEVKPPAGAPNVLLVLIDDMGFGVPSAFGGPVHMPTADRLAQAGLRYNAFHNTAVCSPTRTALLSGRNHHSNNMGGITETATAFPGNTGQRPNNVAPLAEMLRLNGYSTAFYGKNHETAPWEVSVSGPTARWPTRSGLRRVLRLHRRRDQPVGADALPRHEPGRGPEGPELPLHDGHDRQGDRLGEVPEGADAGPALLRLLRAGRDARAAPRAEAVDREVQGPVRPGLGRAARGDARPPDQARRRPPGHEARAEARGDQGLGDALRRREEALHAADGDLRRVRRVHRHRDRPPGRRRRRDGPARQHARHLHHGRQRHERRGRHERDVQRVHLLQRRAGDGRRHPEALRRPRRADVVPPHVRGLGRRGRHAVPVDEADRVRLRRQPHRRDRALAEAGDGEGRGALAVPPRDRRGADRARGRGPARAEERQRRAAAADRGRELRLHLRRREGRGPPQGPVLRDVRQPGALRRRLVREDHPQGALGAEAARRAHRGQVGAATTRAATSA